MFPSLVAVLIWVSELDGIGHSPDPHTDCREVLSSSLRFPALPPEEKERLWEDASPESLEKLSLSFLGLVHQQLRRSLFTHDRYYEDAAQEVYLHGIFDALPKFDPKLWPGDKRLADKLTSYITGKIIFAIRGFMRRGTMRQRLAGKERLESELIFQEDQDDPFNRMADSSPRPGEENEFEIFEQMETFLYQFLQESENQILKLKPKSQEIQRKRLEVYKAIIERRWKKGEIRVTIAKDLNMSGWGLAVAESKLKEKFLAFLRKYPAGLQLLKLYGRLDIPLH